MVQRADEFSLVVVLVDGVAQRTAFLQELAEALGKSFPFLDCDEPTYDPLPKIRQLTPQLPKGIPLILTGMEAWMRRHGAEGEPFWANLNSAREELQEILTCPLILLLPSFLFAEASRAAPDLFSGTSLVFAFQPEIQPPVHPMLWLHYPAMAGLTLSEKRSRLEQFRRTPKPSARAIYVKLELRWWLGQNLSAVRRLSTALRRASGSAEVNRALLMHMTFLEPNLEYYIWCSRLHSSVQEDKAWRPSTNSPATCSRCTGIWAIGKLRPTLSTTCKGLR